MILAVLLFVGICGTICIADAIYKTVVRGKCTQKVMAQYVTCKTHENVGTSMPATYTPCFTYDWKGKEYNAMPISGSLSKKRIMEYHSDQQYEVYIDPRKPERLILNCKISPAEIVNWIAGAGCYFLVLVIVFFMFVEMMES